MYFFDTGDCNFIAYRLEDENDTLIVVFNPYIEERHFLLPEGRFYIRLNDQGKINKFPISGDVMIPPISAMVFKKVRKQAK